jgi:hypothetical protein
MADERDDGALPSGEDGGDRPPRVEGVTPEFAPQAASRASRSARGMSSMTLSITRALERDLAWRRDLERAAAQRVEVEAAMRRALDDPVRAAVAYTNPLSLAGVSAAGSGALARAQAELCANLKLVAADRAQYEAVWAARERELARSALQLRTLESGATTQLALLRESMAGSLGAPSAVQRAWAALDAMGRSAERTVAAALTAHAYERAGYRHASSWDLARFAARVPALETYAASRVAAATLPARLGGAVGEIGARDVEIVGVVELPDSREMDLLLDEIGVAFDSRLAALDPRLAEMYRGAVERIERGGYDWRRQALISLRELATQVLHALAPDPETLAWAGEVGGAGLVSEQGRPTRTGRIKYICREVDAGPLVPFLKKDVAAYLELLDVLQRVHAPEVTFTPKQLQAVRSRVQAMITVFLDLAGQ